MSCEGAPLRSRRGMQWCSGKSCKRILQSRQAHVATSSLLKPISCKAAAWRLKCNGYLPRDVQDRCVCILTYASNTFCKKTLPSMWVSLGRKLLLVMITADILKQVWGNIWDCKDCMQDLSCSYLYCNSSWLADKMMDDIILTFLKLLRSQALQIIIYCNSLLRLYSLSAKPILKPFAIWVATFARCRTVLKSIDRVQTLAWVPA